MKNLLITLAFLLIIFNVSAQDKKVKEVEETVATLRQAILDGDSAKLDQVTDSGLTYGHSLGKLENKQQFIHALASGASDFKTLDLTEQTIVIRGKTAVVRHKLAADIKEGDKFNSVKLAVMMVFVKEDKHWKLLGRQAIRL
jgi:ketosteroid isomerase-like protein